MALLSNVGQIAAKRNTYVYAFFRLCKLHNVSNGQAEDFLNLASVLRSNEAFRAGLFRLATSIKSSEPEVSTNDIVVMVALAVGGMEIAAQKELEAPEDLMAMFRAELPPEPDNSPEPQIPAAQDAQPQPPVQPTPLRAVLSEPTGTTQAPAERPAAPAPMPIRQPGAIPASALPGNQAVTPPAPRRPPILQQALLADLPEEAAPEPAPTPAPPALEVVAKVEQLQSERVELERRLEAMENRLGQVIQELHSRPAPARAEPNADLRSTPPIDIASRRSLHQLSPETPPARSPQPTETEAPPREMSRAAIVVLVLLIAAAALFLVREFGHRHTPASSPTGAQVTTPAAPAISPAPPNPGAQNTRQVPDQSSAPKPSNIRTAEADAHPRQEITRVLNAWASASAHNNPVAESAFYAPQVDRYFLRRNVSRQFILRDKQAYRERGNRMQTFNVRDLSFQFHSPSSVVVSLTKVWTAIGPRQTGTPHASRSRVWLVRTADGWKITGEQDLTPATARSSDVHP